MVDLVSWNTVKPDSNMPIRTDKGSEGTVYYTDDNTTWRNTQLSAIKNSPYYIKKRTAMSRTTIVMVDPVAAQRFLDTRDPDDYTAATHVKTPDEQADQFVAGYDPTKTLRQIMTPAPVLATPQPIREPTVVKGIMDGTVSIRINGELPSTGKKWTFDPLLSQLSVRTVSEIDTHGGKVTGGVVIGTQKQAISVVAWGTYQGTKTETNTMVIDVRDFPELKGSGLQIKYQFVEEPSRGDAFAAYVPSKALLYGTVFVPSAEAPLTGDNGDKADVPKDDVVTVVTAGASKLWSPVQAWIDTHPGESIAIACIALLGLGVAVFAKGNGNNLTHRRL